MSHTTLNQFDVATRNFLTSHRNCPVEITICGLDCHYSADTGTLRRMELLKESNGNVQLNIVLRRGDRSSSLKMIRSIRSINVTGRRLSVDSGNGIQQNLECLAMHNVRGREKLLLIRHIAAITQG
jgi:hypothetical protein